MPRKTSLRCCFGCENDGPLHHFPKPEYPNLDKFNTWKLVLSESIKEKSDSYIYNNIRICDVHFEEVYRSASKRLTQNAVPTLNIPSTSQIKVSVELPIQSSDFASAQTHIKHHAPKKDAQACLNKTPLKIRKSREYQKLYTKLFKLKSKCKDLTMKLRQAANIAQNNSFLKAIDKLPSSAAIFTRMQLNKCNKKARGRRYTIDEKILSLTIYKQSQKAYSLMQRLFSLPSKRSILKMLSSISIKPGVNDSIIEHLKKTVKKMSEEKKLCILLFDEVALTPGLFYQKTLDEIVGFEDSGSRRTKMIADHALVFMIKGLKSKYKQPICFTFCQSATKSAELKILIKTVIGQVQSTGLKIVATVCDQSSTNTRAINDLKNETIQKYLSANKEYKFTSYEIGGHQIFHMYDPPHLLKGLRNNFIDKEVRFIQDNIVKVAKWAHLKMLLDVDNGDDDIRLLNKLTESHINKDKIPKMKVKHAAQVFSQRVSATMKFLTKHNILPQECADTADFLLIIDKLFDSFNGHSYQENKKKYKCALKHNSPHFNLWNEILPILRSIQFKTEKSDSNGTIKTKYVQVPSLKNWIENIQVFKEMFSFLNSNYKVSSLLTRNINQDPLENFFGNIRSNGVRNISPTCCQFIGAFKTLLINNFTSPHSVGANCEKDDNKPIKSLKCLLKYKVIVREEPQSDINVDQIFEMLTQTSQKECKLTERAAKQYVAGYLIKKTGKIYRSCHTCKMELISTTPPNNDNYILCRGYTKHSLNYPSEQLCTLLDDVCFIIQNQLKREPQIKNIKQNIKEISKIYCDCSFFSCNKHKIKLNAFLINVIADVVLHSWCTNVNRLLKGKITTCDNNAVKLQALNYYKKTNRYKRK